jgi:hypothetical protein
MPPIDRNELRRLALLLSLGSVGASATACGGASGDTSSSHGDPTAGGNVNEPTAEAGIDPTAEAYGPTDEAYYGPTDEAYYGPTGEGYPTYETPVYEG